MDSRIIYESSKVYLEKTKWLKSSVESESEWVYLNFEETINEKIIGELICDYLVTENLFIVLNRNASFETEKKNVVSEIKRLLQTENFVIWNQQFEKVIEFNKIGICRKGEEASL